MAVSSTRKKRHSKADIEKACKRHREEGVPVSLLAQEYDVSEQTIRNWLAKPVGASGKGVATEGMGVTSGPVVGVNAPPAPLMYSVSAGAQSVLITDVQLLHYAALGKVRLCIAVPQERTTVSLASIMEAKFRPPYFSDKSNFSRLMRALDRVDYLLVEKEDCARIESAGSAFREKFFGSYLLARDGGFSSNPPPDFSDTVKSILARKERYSFQPLGKFLRPQRVPCFYALAEFEANDGLDIDLDRVNGGLTIRNDDLMIAATELQLLRDAEIGRVSSRQDKEPFHSHENRSSCLSLLDDVAFELWGDFNPIKAAKFNSAEKVAVYLEYSFGFPKTHATRAARMIFHDEKLNPPKSKAPLYRAAMLQDLIDLWGAACQGRSYRKGMHEEALYEKAIADWFNGVGAISGLAKLVELKKTAAVLVRPDNAPFNRLRPKN
ncbi:MAG: hypothetical protein PSX71_11490 [bacterium]|nr:hypothetical protein [bacterium]